MDTNEETVLDETLDSSDDLEINLDEETVEEEEVDWKSVALKEKERAENQKIRAEKAEREARNKPQAPQSSLASRDLIALMNAKVNEDDVSEVEDYAKYRGISIAEALKSSVVKTLLSERSQQRNVALATNTGSARTSSAKVSGDTLLRNANNGKLPDDPAELAKARFQMRSK